MNQRGSNIIELIIASAILVVGVLATSQLYTTQARLAEASARRLEIVALQKESFNVLSTEINCLANFIGVNPNITAAMGNIRDSSGAPRVAVGDVYPRSLRVTGIRRVGPVFPTPIPADGRGRFDVVIDMVLLDIVGTQMQTRVPVFVETNAAGNVQSCSSVGSSRTDCRYVQNSGTSVVTVTCPAEYRVVGGGNEDSDVDKEDVYQSEPIAANPPLTWGGYTCMGQDGRFRRCWAVCCR